MFKWIKKLFKRQENRPSLIGLMITCETLKPVKPIKRKQKRDKYGRFLKG